MLAVKARELGRRGLAVGDRVSLVGDVSGAPDTLARIVRVAERTSVLRRTADDDDPVERVLVANADQLVIVTAVADPEPRPRMIDRCLVAAYDAGLVPLLCLTKSDLADPAALLAAYAPLRVEALAVNRETGAEALRPRLARAAQRPGRPLGGRQVDAGQRSGAGQHTARRPCERRHRARSAHLELGGGAGVAGRWLGDRHPRGAELRARARESGLRAARVRRPRAGRGAVSPRVQPRRTGMCVGRLGRGGAADGLASTRSAGLLRAGRAADETAS